MMTIGLEVQGMTCNHCVLAVTRAVKARDAQAEIRVDLAARRVEVESAILERAAIADAIQEAGYQVER
jgi:copper chaperone